MPLTFVQANILPSVAGPTSTVSGAFTSNVTAGNALQVSITWTSSTNTSISSITDSLGNTWFAAGVIARAGTRRSILYQCQSISSGPNTVSFTFSTSTPTNIVIALSEYTGTAASIVAGTGAQSLVFGSIGLCYAFNITAQVYLVAHGWAGAGSGGPYPGSGGTQRANDSVSTIILDKLPAHPNPYFQNVEVSYILNGACCGCTEPFIGWGVAYAEAPTEFVAPPQMADAMPTPIPAFLRGSIAPKAAGSIVIGKVAGEVPPQFPALLAGSSLKASGRIARVPVADDIPPQFPRSNPGATPPKAGSTKPVRADDIPIVFPNLLPGGSPPPPAGPVLRVAADPIPPQFGAIFYGPPKPGGPVLRLAADPIPPQVGAFIQGSNLGKAGVLIHALPADPIVSQQSALLAGFTRAQPILIAARPIRADDIAPVFPTLLSGARLTAAGVIIQASPTADAIPPVTPQLLQGAILTTAGTIVAPYPVHADDIPVVFPVILRGAKPTSAGLTIRVAAADVVPPQFSALIAGFKGAGTAGSIVSPRPLRADDIPPATSTLIPGFALTQAGSILRVAADIVPPAFPALIQGSKLAGAGSILRLSADPVPPTFSALLAGARLAAAGSILRLSADAIVPQAGAFIQGFTASAAGVIIGPRPIVADDIPPQRSVFLQGARFTAAGRILFGQRADDIPGVQPILTRAPTITTIPILVRAAPTADPIPIVSSQILQGALLPPAGSILSPKPIRADDVSPAFPELIPGAVGPSPIFVIVAPPTAVDIPPQFPALIPGSVAPTPPPPPPPPPPPNVRPTPQTAFSGGPGIQGLYDRVICERDFKKFFEPQVEYPIQKWEPPVTKGPDETKQDAAPIVVIEKAERTEAKTKVVYVPVPVYIETPVVYEMVPRPAPRWLRWMVIGGVVIAAAWALGAFDKPKPKRRPKKRRKVSRRR